MSTPPPSLVWFRLDLRLDDNPALLAAAGSKSPVIPVFIWAPEEEDPWAPGAASRCWLHQSLSSLQKRLAAQGSRLILLRGPTLTMLERLIAETGAAAVYWNRRYEPVVIARDTAIKSALGGRGIRVETFNAATLFEPHTIRSKSTERPFQVFSAFWKTCLSQPAPAAPQAAPKRLGVPASWPKSLELSELKLEPESNWASGFRSVWNPGEPGASEVLKRFVRSRLNDYPRERDRPDHTGTSRMSPHLHFGEISPRRTWHEINKAKSEEPADCYLRELGWREFAYHLLFHFPQTTNRPLRAEFQAFPWRSDSALLKKWQRGKTGYPLVDAGMRELWATGWMHNRVRMVAASFLTKHLRINWEEGAYWFWDTLVDADLANNTLGWQWTAGCGADAAPYFRIFNPVRQRERFDPDSEYIRRWVPELRLGEPYPAPIVDHDIARREALVAFQRIRKST